MITGAEKEEIKAEYRAERAGHADADKKKRERVVNETLRLLREPGATEESVYPIICKRFGVGPKYIENRFLARAGVTSMVTLKLNEAQILKQVAAQCQFAQDACNHIDEQLEIMAASDDTESFAIEITEHDRLGTSTKKLPKPIAMLRLLENKIKYQADVLRGMQSLMPQSVINQIFDNRRAVDDLDDSQLDRELKVALRTGHAS